MTRRPLMTAMNMNLISEVDRHTRPAGDARMSVPRQHTAQCAALIAPYMAREVRRVTAFQLPVPG